MKKKRVTYYHVRIWHPAILDVSSKFLTLDDIIRNPRKEHLNMSDVGLILLNLERQKMGLDQIDPKLVKDNNGSYGIPCTLRPVIRTEG